MALETAAQTIIGQERSHNEDSVHVEPAGEQTLLVVADGMGGHRAGDVASEEAIMAFVDYVLSFEEYNEQVLVEAVQTANTHVFKMATNNPELDGMGTTLVAALVDGEDVTVVNVGDSRTYQITETSVEQVTTDQSMVQQLVEQNQISAEEAEEHPQKHVLAQALGTQPTVEPDTYELTLEGTLLLCSDGLCDETPEREMHEIVTSAATLDRAAEALVERANELDGSDNISVALGRAAKR